MESKRFLKEKFKKVIEILSEPFYTYFGDEGVIYDEFPLEEIESSWCSGCTKVCVVEDNVVFKTSFRGYVYDFDDEKNDYYDEPIIERWNTDYCKLEFDVYVEALTAGLGKFFAKTIQVSPYVYAQEKCEIDLCNLICSNEKRDFKKSSLEDKELEDYIKSKGLSSLSISLGLTAMSFLIAQYDIDDLYELEKFIDDYDINDLHSSNMGFFNGKLKFFDFSGYNSDTFELLKNKTA